MIFDRIENCGNYAALGEKIQKGFDFIKKAVSENLPVGKYEIDGTEVFAMVQEYTSKLREGAFFEAHKKYIDIQYVVNGIEEIGVCDISKGSIKTEYSEEIEAAFYHNNDKGGMLVLEEGDFAIFYPNDLHMPGIAFDEKTSDVKKIVVKVRV